MIDCRRGQELTNLPAMQPLSMSLLAGATSTPLPLALESRFPPANRKPELCCEVRRKPEALPRVSHVALGSHEMFCLLLWIAQIDFIALSGASAKQVRNRWTSVNLFFTLEPGWTHCYRVRQTTAQRVEFYLKL